MTQVLDYTFAKQDTIREVSLLAGGKEPNAALTVKAKTDKASAVEYVYTVQDLLRLSGKYTCNVDLDSIPSGAVLYISRIDCKDQTPLTEAEILQRLKKQEIIKTLERTDELRFTWDKTLKIADALVPDSAVQASKPALGR